MLYVGYVLEIHLGVNSIIDNGTEKSLNQTLSELEIFSRISGLNVNFEKTQLVWIGSEKYSIRSIKTKWKLSWGKNTFKLLGINFNINLIMEYFNHTRLTQ